MRNNLAKLKYLLLNLKLFLYSGSLINASSLATLFFFQGPESIDVIIKEIISIYPQAEIISVTIVARDSTNSYGLLDIVYKKNIPGILDEHKAALLNHLQDRELAASIIKKNEDKK